MTRSPVSLRRIKQRVCDDAGAAALELALVAVGFIVLLLLLAYAWRVSQAIGDVSDAAAEVARSASLDDNTAAAEQIAQQFLAQQHVSCGAVTASVSRGAHTSSGIHPTDVDSYTATVTCTIELGDLALLGVPGTQEITRTHTEVIDVYTGGRK